MEEYQERQKGHFGTTANDLKMAFVFLGWEQGLIDPQKSDSTSELALFMPFSILIPIILQEYQTFYCNDEGESWDPWSGLEPSWRRNRLLDCFAGKPTPVEVSALLVELGWTREVIGHFLEGRAEYWEEDSPVIMGMDHILSLH